MISERSRSPTLLFDGECRVCRTFAGFVYLWGRPRGLRVLPFQEKEARSLLVALTDEEVRRSAHLVLEDGEVLSGRRAFPALLDRLPALGALHRRLGNRFIFPRLVRALYDAGVTLRGALRCTTARPDSTA
ncbi:MAG: DCC1-like thiol-disulfide oxidoreductase family protein [Thermoplasmata archaeon]